jgi:hypothetical protein
MPSRLRSVFSGENYLVTIHGYPTNLSVCEQLIALYNQDQSSSALPGEYFCEELRFMRLQVRIELGENGSIYPRPKGKPR